MENQAVKEERGTSSHTHPALAQLQPLGRSRHTGGRYGHCLQPEVSKWVQSSLHRSKRMFGTSRDGSNRADFCQGNLEELHILASGKVLPPLPLNSFVVPATSRIQRCPFPGAALLPASAPHLTTLSASPVSESPVPRSPLTQPLPLQTKQDDK